MIESVFRWCCHHNRLQRRTNWPVHLSVVSEVTSAHVEAAPPSEASTLAATLNIVIVPLPKPIELGEGAGERRSEGEGGEEPEDEGGGVGGLSAVFFPKFSALLGP